MDVGDAVMQSNPEASRGLTFMKQEEYASFVNSPHLCNSMPTNISAQLNSRHDL